MAEVETRRVDVSAATFFRLLGVVALGWAWLRLWQWFLIFIIAAFLAVALDPAVVWLDRRGLRRRWGGPLIVLLITVSVGGFLWIAGAELKTQAGLVGSRIAETRAAMAERLPESILQQLPILGETNSGSGEGGADAQQAPSRPSPSGGDSSSGDYAMRFARSLLSGLLSIAVALVLTAYLLLDGRRTFEWFVAFAPPPKRARLRRTADAARGAIIGYMRGNVATSVLATVITLVVLSLLKVPGALLLAILAGILNFVPVVGLILSLVPAVLLASTVSPAVAAIVGAFYLTYNAVESYYIQPRVYGHEMQLSSLAVLAAFAAGAELGGVLGALIALPIAAMYPPVEELWLKRKLPASAAEDHRRIERRGEY